MLHQKERELERELERAREREREREICCVVHEKPSNWRKRKGERKWLIIPLPKPNYHLFTDQTRKPL
jgi:hypothetical protein